MTSNQKGAIAEQAIALAAAKLDLPVARPNLDARYDLILDLGSRLLRVQCKWGTLDGPVIRTPIGGCWHSPTRGYVRTSYSAEEVDAIGIYCAGLDHCYLVPVEIVEGRSNLHLRLEPAANGQRACLHWAADYEFPGAIAQLEERRHGMAEVVGSSPTSSTRTEVIGVDELRNRLGWYAERASLGETIHVTRRGKPYARLLPPEGLFDEVAA